MTSVASCVQPSPPALPLPPGGQDWAMRCTGIVAFLARCQGFVVNRVRRAVSGSVYISLCHAVTGIKACVRLGDHRTQREKGRMFSVRVQAPGRLLQLEDWLRDVARGEGLYVKGGAWSRAGVES